MRFKVRALRIDNTAEGRREVARTRADEAGVAKMTDKSFGLALKAHGLKPAGANILKQEALSVGCDAAVSRGVINCSVETTDALIMGTKKQMKRLVTKLKPQPFGLKVLGGEITEVLENLEKPLVWSIQDKDFDLSARTLVMGIVNVTPDSFSDGGDNQSLESAVATAMKMVEEGADILDIGGESTRPGAAEVSLEDELDRVIPVIRAIKARTGTPISIDTYKSEVASRAVEAGATIINDISGLNLDPRMAEVAAATKAGLILMHMRGTPRDMQTNTVYGDLVGEIYGLLAQSVEKALAAGVAKNRIAIDPGIGFGKDATGNLILLKRLSEFTSMGLPILLGASRKTFIGRILDLPEPKDRLEGSLAAAVLGVSQGAGIIRVHDVLPTRRAVDLAHAVKRAVEL